MEKHKIIIIDTSVLVKFFVKEAGSDKVKELIKQHLNKDITLLSTQLLVFEFLNTIIRCYPATNAATKIYDDFKSLGIGIMPFERPVIKGAIGLAYKSNKISFYDSAYHALAKDMEATFLTADRKYYELMKKEGNIELFT